MVIRLLVFLAFVIGILVTFPGVRQWLGPKVEPIAAPLRPVVGGPVKKLLNPVFRWSAKNESQTLLRGLVERMNTGQALPSPSRFQAYLQRENVGRGGLDPWGKPYYLVVRAESVVVASPGPDTVARNQDDIRAVYRRITR